jgi:hypothetical protein
MLQTPSTAPFRALTLYERLPKNCEAILVEDDDSAPHLKHGEYAVIDRGDCKPQHGELYAIKWLDGCVQGRAARSPTATRR